MIVSNNLRIFATLAAVLLLLPADALEASTRKGEKYVKEARAAEAAQDARRLARSRRQNFMGDHSQR